MVVKYEWEDCHAIWSYSDILKNDDQVLYGENICSFGKHPTNPISKPLGALYDEVHDEWIISDSGNDALRFFGLNSHVGDIVKGERLKNPSALATWYPGKLIAVLDEDHIRLFDRQSEEFITIANAKKCRGLGITSKGEFVTIQLRGERYGDPEIVFYSPQMPNKVVRKNRYEISVRNNDRPNPCFLDVSHNNVCVTDLGVNGFSIYALDLPTLEMELKTQEIHPGENNGQFKYISGVKFDKNYELIIADATGQKLQYFDKDGRYLHRVNFSDDFCYASNIAMNSKNQLLVCDRRNGNLKLYQLKGRESRELFEKPNFSCIPPATSKARQVGE